MRNTIYGSGSLEPEEFDDVKEIYEEVSYGIGVVETEKDAFYVKRRFLKGFEVEVASYHILGETLSEQDDAYFLPDKKITFTEYDEDSTSLDKFYCRSSIEAPDIDYSSLIESLSSKVLLGDPDIELRNFLFDGDTVKPIDFEMAGSKKREKRIQLKALNIIRETSADFSYRQVVEEAERLYNQIDTEEAYRRIQKNGLMTDNVRRIFEYMDKGFS